MKEREREDKERLGKSERAWEVEVSSKLDGESERRETVG